MLYNIVGICKYLGLNLTPNEIGALVYRSDLWMNDDRHSYTYSRAYLQKPPKLLARLNYMFSDNISQGLPTFISSCRAHAN